GDQDAVLEAGEDLNSFVDIGALATEGYLKSASDVKSADTRLNTTAINTVLGSYGWYIDSTGIVNAIFWYDADNGHAGGGKTATDNATDVDSGEVLTGFQTDIYP
ncbi:MAG: hypothetical protein ABII90_01240, partial [Bacteroidota bacterium]